MDSQEALALWKHASAMLGWNKANLHELHRLGESLWSTLNNTKEGLIFLLDSNAPSSSLIDEYQKLTEKKPSWLPRQQYHLFLEALSTSPTLNDEIAILLLDSAPTFSKLLVSQNPHISEHVARQILNTANTKLIISLSKNLGLQLETARALMSIRNSEIHNNLVISATTMVKERYQMLLSSSSLLSPEMLAYVKGSLVSPSDGDNHVDSWILFNNRPALIGMSRNAENSESAALKLLALADFQILMGLASNAKTPSDVLLELAHPFRHEAIKLKVTSNKSSSLAVTARLLADDSASVRASALQHDRSLKEGIISEIVFDEHDEVVLTHAYCHPKASKETQRQALQRIKNPALLREIVKSLTPLSEEFFHYALALDPSLLGYAVQHPFCPHEFVQQAERSSIITEKLATKSRLVRVTH